jgi:hypothetical protein
MANIKKITPEELRNMVLAEAKEIKKKLYEEEAFKALEDPLEQEMNQNDGLGDSNKAVVYKGTDKTETKSGKASAKAPADVKMNANAKDQGSDPKAATAVSVKAGAEKGGKGYTAGQHKANFESKKDNPKTDVSKPFVETSKDEMEKMDKNIDDVGTKTFVEAGAEKGGKGITAGQHKAVVKEKAPVTKDKEPIMKGIETEQGNSNHDGDVNKKAKSQAVTESVKVTLKESYTRKELIETVKREAAKIARKSMLEEQLKRIDDELSKL